MVDDDERFTELVYAYFHHRGTYPIFVSYQCPVTDVDLEDLQHRLFTTYRDLDDIELLTTERVDSDYWSGVLLELDDDEFHDTDDEWGNDLMDISDPESRPAHFPAHQIHHEVAPTSHEKTWGFNCGASDVSASCALQALGWEYFQRERRPSV